MFTFQRIFLVLSLIAFVAAMEENHNWKDMMKKNESPAQLTQQNVHTKDVNKINEENAILVKMMALFEEQTKTSQQQNTRIHDLETLVQNQEASLSEFNARATEMDAQNQDLKAKVGKQEANLGDLNERNQGLETKVREVDVQNQDLKAKVEELYEKIQGLEKTVRQHETKMEQQTLVRKDLQKDNDATGPFTKIDSAQFYNPRDIVRPRTRNVKGETSDDATGPSAFTATVHGGRAYNTGDTVIFDAIVTNIGNNYLSETSTYVCPRDGLYVFSLTVFNRQGNYMTADLMCGDKQLATACAINDDFNQASVTVVTECVAGEQVYAKATGASSRAAGLTDTKYNIFSGFLLQAY